MTCFAESLGSCQAGSGQAGSGQAETCDYQPGESPSPGEEILKMIVGQCSLPEVFEAVCRQIGDTGHDRQIAFFRLDADSWSLAAMGELTPAAAEALARLAPEYLSGELLRYNSGAAVDPESGTRAGMAFEEGWARHLYSGLGELLGLLVWFAAGPFTPEHRLAARIDCLCRLTTLAMEQSNLHEELSWQGDHDPVTGLCTQAFFERTLASQMRRDSAPVALLHVNLDRFRLINDVLGRGLGDRILRYVGKRFSAGVSAEDLVARAGGDEFVVLLRPGTAERAAAVAARLLELLASPVSADSHQVFVSASIGIARSRAGSTPQSLQREAYVALYHAKKDGKARALAFDASMAATPPERLEMEKCLRSALSRNEMLLYYQPQVDLTTGRVAGAEALLRWNPPGVGIISPDTIIPILEETALIVEFGLWVLREACSQGKRWLDAIGAPVRIGVNVSALQLSTPGFVADVAGVLRDFGQPAEYLELELTESLLVRDYAFARKTLAALRDLGVSLALDDFGAGQSSLAYLHELPFHRVKIDQSFVRAVHAGNSCPPVIENIVRLTKSLGMTSIAEGIERPDQADLLRAVACDEGQGFLYSRPLPAAEFLNYCTGRKSQPRTRAFSYR